MIHRPEEFEAMYATTPPWDIGHPQPVFQALAGSGAIRGRVLDVGCGTGEHALMTAALGLEATGIDSSPTAISRAEAKATERRLIARFLVWNALELASLGGLFDTVLDSGLFHVFDDADRHRFVESIRSVVPAGGRYFMLCFSERQSGDFGPRRVTQSEIRSSFDDGWRVDSIEPAKLEVGMIPERIPDGPDGIAAWRASLTRI